MNSDELKRIKNTVEEIRSRYNSRQQGKADEEESAELARQRMITRRVCDPNSNDPFSVNVAKRKNSTESENKVVGVAGENKVVGVAGSDRPSSASEAREIMIGRKVR